MTRAPSLLLGLLLAACNVEPLHVEQQGLGSLLDEPTGACGRGLVVVNSDYQSSNVSLVSNTGELLSQSLVASGNFSPGLSMDFSGDLVLSSTRTKGDELILLDRYPGSVLSFVSLRDAQVRAQLDITTGFKANPHDAIVLPSGLIYVTRYGTNPDSGRFAFDQGGDLLLIDPTIPEIVARLGLAEALPEIPSPLFPNPDRALLVNDTLYVVVATYSLDYKNSGSSFVVAVDPNRNVVVGSLALEGLHGCAGIAVRDDSRELTVACSGKWHTPKGATVAESGLVGIDITDGMKKVWQLPASRLSPAQPFAFTVAYASPTQIVAATFGSLITNSPDRLVAYRPGNDTLTTLEESSPAFSLGDVRCMSPCSRCVVADASRGGLSFWDFAGTTPKSTFVSLDDGIGLPPRWIGRF
jgi:hypothetical protein